MGNIILIGFMGSGKSSVGIHLSYRLRQSLQDTDKRIVREQGCGIPEIFARSGEAAFRQMEHTLLVHLKETARNQIIATGGGLVLQEDNRRLLKEIGEVVYLRAGADTIYERVKRDQSRPLLQCEDPYGRICELLKERAPIYEQAADIIIDVDGKDFRRIVNEIQIALGKRKTENRGSRKKGAAQKKLLVINGPNLNFLGIREKNIYGTQDYNYLLRMIEKKARQSQCEIQVYQSNHEGAIIDRIQEAYFDGTQGIVINPGAYTHYSYAIHDALASITVPKAEIHISDITKREPFRSISVTAPACDTQIYGHGLEGYLMAVDFVLERIEARTATEGVR